VQGSGSVIIQGQPTGALKHPHASTSQQSPNKQQVQLSPKQQQQPMQPQAVASKDKKPKRTGSLGLFFRKVMTG
jgi:sRNA-binding protein